MAQSKIQQVFEFGWQEYCSVYPPSHIQKKAAMSILRCKTGALAALSASVPIADIPNSTTIPAATVTVPAARL